MRVLLESTQIKQIFNLRVYSALWWVALRSHDALRLLPFDLHLTQHCCCRGWCMVAACFQTAHDESSDFLTFHVFSTQYLSESLFRSIYYLDNNLQGQGQGISSDQPSHHQSLILIIDIINHQSSTSWRTFPHLATPTATAYCCCPRERRRLQRTCYTKGPAVAPEPPEKGVTLKIKIMMINPLRQMMKLRQCKSYRYTLVLCL